MSVFYNCQKLWFCNGICNLAIYCRLKATIYNVKTSKASVVSFVFIIIGYINLLPTYAMFSECFNGFSLAWYSTLNESTLVNIVDGITPARTL